ncbi:MAG: tetratricopeptide repeat protein [Desulfosalsimonas sp.]
MKAETAAKGNEAGEQQGNKKGLFEDEFLKSKDLVTVNRDVAARRVRRVMADIGELIRENRWADALSLYYPVDEKLPEAADHGLDMEVREKVAFVLGQLRHYDDAIRDLQLCVKADPERFMTRSSLAYTAYDSLYALKNREIVMSPEQKAERVRLAHENFQKAQEIRPDGVTNYYRQGMLFRQIEGKTDQAAPLFQKAVENWQALSNEARENRQQERKNYIKALYQLAGCRMEADQPDAALEALRECLAADETSNHIALVHKYFALGKIHFAGGSFSQARDALLFAAQCGRAGKQGIDYVYELLARTYLGMGAPRRAMEAVNQQPEGRRRPYYRWTEADVHVALGDLDKACAVLVKSQERDNRSKHKALVKLARIEYLRGNFEAAREHCDEADRFFREKWKNPCLEALFWGALSACRAGSRARAEELLKTLEAHAPYYPKLSQLGKTIRGDNS